MKRATLVVGKFYQSNRIFNLNDPISNRDNCMYPFYMLKEKLRAQGFDLCTQDIFPAHDSEIVIYNEMPTSLPHKNDIKKSFLLIFESELVRPDNWNKESHKHFAKVFTWNDDFIDNEKYIKYNFSQLLPECISKNSGEKFCTLIAGNKKSSHRLELYSHREKAIKWFESNHPESFDYYGIGWDRYSFKYLRPLNRLKIPKLFGTSMCYKGMVAVKNETLSQYKFAICYENAKSIPGYITEKIFDCFLAGCIPVYWGPDNIESHIPQKCFIDKRDFRSYEELYLYLTTLPQSEIEQYKSDIQEFISSGAANVFTADHFAEVITEKVCND